MYILGISAFYHDSAACLLKDGVIVAASQEERFTRVKHDCSFPTNAVVDCLKQANISLDDVQYVSYYEKPFLTFERLLGTYLEFAPKGFKSFSQSMPVWIKEKLFIKRTIKKELKKISKSKRHTPEILFCEHHQSHAASAFFPSPFDKAAILCIDGVGEYATTSVWFGEGNKLTPIWEIHYPHSLGLLYSAFTSYVGLKVNSGEYKLMGLAPYGEPKYVDSIYEHLIDVKNDGTFHLNMKYFNFATGLTMTNELFHDLFGGPPRPLNSAPRKREMDLARSIQVVLEDVILKLVENLKDELGVDKVCLAGGVALNCVANGRIVKESKFKDIFVQPAAGDAGGALGAAYCIHHEYLNRPRVSDNKCDHMLGAYLGNSFSNDEIQLFLDQQNVPYKKYSSYEEVNKELIRYIEDDKVIGIFRGRMEFGPRALCNRSIIGNPRCVEMQKTLNLKIKKRESFRPFAPVVLKEFAFEFFDLNVESPYMNLVADVKDHLCYKYPTLEFNDSPEEKLRFKKSDIPAITHVDYTARVQTLDKKYNVEFYDLLTRLNDNTNVPVLINTSFNVRGEPIVCFPKDAFACFVTTDMDVLVLEDYIIRKEDVVSLIDRDKWSREYPLD